MLLAALLASGPPAAAAEPLAHARWGVDEGLPVAAVSDLTFDARGYLWLATFDGLARFDGARFVVFSAENTPGLPSNRLVTVQASPDGALVFATEAGHVGRFDPVAGAWHAASATNDVPIVVLGEGGDVWTATDRGVARLEGDALAPFGPDLGEEVTSLAVDPDGAVWAGTRRGLARVTADAVRWWTAADGLPDGRVTSVALGARDELWIATEAGPARRVGGRLAPLVVDGAAWREPALYARPDGEGGAWVGTQTGLFRWADGRAVRVDPEDRDRAPLRAVVADDPRGTWVLTRRSLVRGGEVVHRVTDPTRHGFTDLVADAEGGVWVGTSDDGLHRFAPAPLRTLGVAEGMSHPNAYALAAAAGGGVWVGTQRGGLARVTPSGAEVVFAEDGPDRNVSAVLETRSGELWIGTHDAGIFRRGPDGAFVAEGLGPTSVKALEELADGTLLAGTRDGLWRRRGGAWERWALPDLPAATVRAVLEGPDGALWLGTQGEGVARVVGDRVERLDRASGWPSDQVRALWAAPDGVVWVGTEDRGMYAVVDPARPGPAPLSTAEGLPDHCVHALVDDGAGGLWGSTNRGLFRIAVDDLAAFARGGAGWIPIEPFDQRDGMANPEANGGVHRTGVRARDGALWFATQAGVVTLDPAALRIARRPPVLLEDLELGGRALPLPPGPLVLGPDQRTFGLTYTALAYHAPDRQRFWTRMDGLADGSWTYHADRRTAWFTALPPGDYTFRVRATPPGSDGPEAAVAVRVVPVWTETSLFRALAFGCALGLVALAGWLRVRAGERRQRELEGLVLARTADLAAQTAAAEEARATVAEQARRLREIDGLKTRFFEDLSHELRTPLTLLLGPLEDARTGRLGEVPAPAAEALARAERSARRLRGLVDQLLDLVRIDVGALKLTLAPRDLVPLLRRLADEFGPAAERRGLRLDVTLPDRIVAVSCDARELEKVFVNLLGNALKFTPAGGTVRLSLAADGGRARVEVADDGPGISPEDQARIFDRFTFSGSSTLQAGTGLGLSLARELAERHGGALSLTSAPGEGATFAVTLPIVDVPVVAPPDEPPAQDRQLEVEPAPAPVDERDRVTVLVVDDEPELRGWIRSILSPRYRVLEAGDGLEALAVARAELPDLVVSDVMMPTLDGFGLVRALRADRALDWLPIVLLTARGSETAHVEGVIRGADAYLTKPFSTAVLLAHVGQLLAQRERLRLAAGPAAPVEEVLSADERYLRKVRAAIEARMADPTFSVEDLADAVGQDRSHLFRQLKELTGEPPSVLLRTMRLERAAKLLSAKAGNVSEIGHASGFASVSQFSRAFKAHFGVPPSEWT